MQTHTHIAIVELDGRLMARCGESAGRGALDAQGLHALIGEYGYGAWALSDEAMTALLLRCESEPGAFEHPIGERRDAEVAVEVAADAMQAWIAVVPARGGQPPTMASLAQTLAAAGVVHGVQTDALEQACAARQPLRVVAARGTPPCPGEDTRFELLVADTRDRRPKVDEHGLVDFHELGDIPIVHPGQALMRRHPPTPGVPGCDVLGKAIAAAPGRDEPFESALSGAAPSGTDPDLLCALVVGQPVHTDRAVMVESVLRLAEVSLESGNVHFEGTIDVGGDVHPGMTIEASGDIIVGGLVEGATLAAGGSVRVGGGVIANAVVRSGDSFSARFVEHAKVHAATTIAINDTAVHSELQAQREVAVGSKAGRCGRLVGGSTRAMLRVTVPTLGVPAGGLTKVQVGVDPMLDARQLELTASIAQQESDVAKLGQVVRHLESHGDPRGMLERALASRQHALAVLCESRQELAQIESSLGLACDARIEILSGIEGDVDLAFGATLRHLRRPYGPGSFGVGSNGRIEFTPASGAAQAVE